jgi:5-methylcytosine-specific restriction endonuclease McrA
MPPGWPQTRVRILRRDPVCWCGAPTTEVHHLEPGNDADWALRGLCSDCHRAVTQHQAAAARGTATR